jgi:hypothetical protein
MSPPLRWVFGRDTGDLPIMKRSGMMSLHPPLKLSAAERLAWHWECSGTCLESAGSWGAGLALGRTRPPRLSHNSSMASDAGPFGHVGSRRAESSKPRRGLHARRRGPADRVASPGALSVGRHSAAIECCAKATGSHSQCHADAEQIHFAGSFWPGAGSRCSGVWRPGETRAVAWMVAGLATAGGLHGWQRPD